MMDTAIAIKTTPGHMCRIVLAVSSAILLIPYMVLKHGPLHLDSNLVRKTIILKESNSSVITMRYLQAISNSKPVSQRKYMTEDLSSPLEVASVVNVLNYNTTRNGYLIGNISHLVFKEYPDEVDLRIIVLTYNRGKSLSKCLNSLNTVDFSDTTVSIHVWIDRSNETGLVDNETLHTARGFFFSQGAYHTHIHPYHVGILNQWVNVWRPWKQTREIALILEDDMVVSRHFWRWLKPVHAAYHNGSNISGYGLSHPGMEHMHATYLDIPAKFSTYMYRVICTWGFSPHPNSWRHFQEWFYQTETNSSFLPLVPGILPTKWFLGELELGQERNLWEMWHICFSHYSKPKQYTIMLNTAQEGLLAVNRHEAGLHDKGTAKADPLCEVWKETYGIFPKVLPQFGYDGKLENAPNLEEEEEEGKEDEGPEPQIGEMSFWH